MRFSELLKNKTNPETPSKPVVFPPKPEAAKPLSKPAEPKPEPPQMDLEAEKAKLEAKMRAEFEDKFQSRLEGMMDRLRKDMEEKVGDQEKRIEEKEKVSDQEKQKLLETIEDLNNKLAEKPKETASDKPPAPKTEVETEVQKRLEQEREKIQQDVKQKLSNTHKSIVDQLQQKIKEQQKALETSPPKPPKQKPIVQPAVPLKPTPPAPVPVPSGKPATVLTHDPEAERKAKQTYNDLLRIGEQINSQIVQGGPIEIASLNRKIEEVVGLIGHNDAPYVGLTLQAYPSESYFSNHSANCALLSIVLGQSFDLSKAELIDLGLVGFLHDVGLVNVRENLDYPKQLPPDIKQEILNHPNRGRELLGSSVSDNVLTAIEQHHETCDGKGYPNGIQGPDIHHYAKIIQCVDTFEALIHERPYRKTPMPVNEAMKELIEKGRGTYDALVLKSLMGRIGLYPVMSMVELSNRQIGRVLRQNPKFPLSPVIRIEFDEEGNKYKNPPVMDLTENQMMHIVGPVTEVTSYAKRRGKTDSKHKKAKTTIVKIQAMLPGLVIGLALLLLFYIILKV